MQVRSLQEPQRTHIRGECRGLSAKCMQDKGSAARQMSHKLYSRRENLVSMILLDHIE
jgi:hypothetical protein